MSKHAIDAKTLLERGHAYFDACKASDAMPHPSGLCRELGISMRTFQDWCAGKYREELQDSAQILHTRCIADITDWGVAHPRDATMPIFVSKSQLKMYDRPDTTRVELTGKDGKELSVALIPMPARSLEEWEQMAHEELKQIEGPADNET